MVLREYAHNSGVANLGLDGLPRRSPPRQAPAPAPEERNRILDLFRNDARSRVIRPFQHQARLGAGIAAQARKELAGPWCPSKNWPSKR